MKSLHELAETDARLRSNDFVHFAKLMLMTNGSLSAMVNHVNANHAPARVKNMVTRAFDVGRLDHPDGFADREIVASGFVDSLRSLGAFDGMLNDFVRVPMDLPGLRVMSDGVSAYAVGEGAPTPLSSFNLAPNTMVRYKADAIVVLTSELVRSTAPGAMALLGRELRTAVVAETDRTFLSVIADDVQPTASSGATVAAVTADLGTAMAAMSLHSGSRVYVVAAPLAARRLQLKLATAGVSLGDVTLIASDNLPNLGSPDENVAMVVDASGVAAATEVVELETSTEAALQMTTEPSAGATNLVSLWQTNSRALRAQRTFAFVKFRSDCVRLISNVSW